MSVREKTAIVSVSCTMEKGSSPPTPPTTYVYRVYMPFFLGNNARVLSVCGLWFFSLFPNACVLTLGFFFSMCFLCAWIHIARDGGWRLDRCYGRTGRRFALRQTSSHPYHFSLPIVSSLSHFLSMTAPVVSLLLFRTTLQPFVHSLPLVHRQNKVLLLGTDR